MHGNRQSQPYLEALPDFVMLAQSYAHVGMRVERPGDVALALREAFALKDRPELIAQILDYLNTKQFTARAPPTKS